MAEEEVLDETPVAAGKGKKDGGGGVKLMHLIIIGVLLIIVTAASTMFLSKSVTGLLGPVDEQIEKMRTQIQGEQARNEGKVSVGECETVYRLTPEGEQIIVNMADGKHYISTELAVCVDGKKITEEDFEMRIPQIRHVVNDSLSRITHDDLFSAKGSIEDAKEADELGIPAEITQGNATFAKNLNFYRGELITDLGRNFPWLRDIYIISFLVQ